MKRHQFWTYILTNINKAVLYTGVTNNLPARLIEHWIGREGSFTTRYNIHYLVWYEETKYVLNAIAREKEIKDWKRIAKDALITDANPEWDFWNQEMLGNWPPTEKQIAVVKERWKVQAEKQSFGPLSFNQQGDGGATGLRY